MFTHHCTDCDRTQLTFLSQLVGVTASADGAIATFTCWCGSEQTADFSLLETATAPVSPVPVTA